MPSPQLASVSAPLPGGPARRPGLGQGRAGGAAAIRAGPRHVPGRRAGPGKGRGARLEVGERASERERMREKVRVRAACVLVGAKVWRERAGVRRSVAGEEVCRGAPSFVRRVSTGILEAPWSLCC